MDPAGTSSCAQDYHHGDGSNPHTLYSTGPEAQRGLPEDGRTIARTDYGLQPTEADFREEKAAEVAKKSKDQYGWRRVIRNFTPSYAQAFHSDHHRNNLSIIATALVTPDFGRSRELWPQLANFIFQQ